MESAKVLIEVTAGLVPGTPEPDFSKQWGITSYEWEDCPDISKASLLFERIGQAQGYAFSLPLPNRVNWTRIDVVWL